MEVFVSYSEQLWEDTCAISFQVGVHDKMDKDFASLDGKEGVSTKLCKTEIQ